jgi:GntR family carbon starvation induced transcriptional regulator
LIRLCGLLYDKSERYRNLAVRTMHANDRDTVNEHKLLVDAALARDANALTSILAEHFFKTTSVILDQNFADPQGKPTQKVMPSVLNGN